MATQDKLLNGAGLSQLCSDIKDYIDEHSGSGDVSGPSSSINNALAIYDGTTGKLLKNCTITASENIWGATAGLTIDAKPQQAGITTAGVFFTLKGASTGNGFEIISQNNDKVIQIKPNGSTTTQGYLEWNTQNASNQYIYVDKGDNTKPAVTDIGRDFSPFRNGYFSGNVYANNIPAPPSDDGGYVLKCQIVGGNPTYSWVAE